MKLPLDAYSFKARFLPALIVLTPIVGAASAWVPLEQASLRALVPVACLAALATLLSHFVRDVGKRRESELFKGWDGSPSVRYLRHRDDTLPEATKSRYHAKLGTLVPGVELPSRRSESAKPDAADTVYASCCDWLREATRERPRFALLFEENVGYGFRRNLWAMKGAGILTASIGLLAGLARVTISLYESASPSIESLAVVLLSIVMLVWWVGRISRAWIASAADAYARRLLAACDTL